MRLTSWPSRKIYIFTQPIIQAAGSMVKHIFHTDRESWLSNQWLFDILGINLKRYGWPFVKTGQILTEISFPVICHKTIRLGSMDKELHLLCSSLLFSVLTCSSSTPRGVSVLSFDHIWYAVWNCSDCFTLHVSSSFAQNVSSIFHWNKKISHFFGWNDCSFKVNKNISLCH